MADIGNCSGASSLPSSLSRGHVTPALFARGLGIPRASKPRGMGSQTLNSWILGDGKLGVFKQIPKSSQKTSIFALARTGCVFFVCCDLCVTHKSTVARTVMCPQDGKGRFPVLLDDHSKCRTNSQRKSQLS